MAQWFEFNLSFLVYICYTVKSLVWILMEDYLFWLVVLTVNGLPWLILHPYACLAPYACLTPLTHWRFKPMSYRKWKSDCVRCFKTDIRYQMIIRLVKTVLRQIRAVSNLWYSWCICRWVLISNRYYDNDRGIPWARIEPSIGYYFHTTVGEMSMMCSSINKELARMGMICEEEWQWRI